MNTADKVWIFFGLITGVGLFGMLGALIYKGVDLLVRGGGWK